MLFCIVFETYRRIKMQMATRVQAKSVPIDIMSTRAFRSNTKAIIAINTNSSLIEFQRQKFNEDNQIYISHTVYSTSGLRAVAFGAALNIYLWCSSQVAEGMSCRLVTAMMVYYCDVFSKRITCYYSRRECGDDRALSRTHVTQWFEEQPISGHSKQHTRHRKHGSQQTVEQ